MLTGSVPCIGIAILFGTCNNALQFGTCNNAVQFGTCNNTIQFGMCIMTGLTTDPGMMAVFNL